MNGNTMLTVAAFGMVSSFVLLIFILVGRRKHTPDSNLDDSHGPGGTPAQPDVKGIFANEMQMRWIPKRASGRIIRRIYIYTRIFLADPIKLLHKTDKIRYVFDYMPQVSHID